MKMRQIPYLNSDPSSVSTQANSIPCFFLKRWNTKLFVQLSKFYTTSVTNYSYMVSKWTSRYTFRIPILKISSTDPEAEQQGEQRIACRADICTVSLLGLQGFSFSFDALWRILLPYCKMYIYIRKQIVLKYTYNLT